MLTPAPCGCLSPGHATAAGGSGESGSVMNPSSAAPCSQVTSPSSPPPHGQLATPPRDSAQAAMLVPVPLLPAMEGLTLPPPPLPLRLLARGRRGPRYVAPSAQVEPIGACAAPSPPPSTSTPATRVWSHPAPAVGAARGVGGWGCLARTTARLLGRPGSAPEQGFPPPRLSHPTRAAVFQLGRRGTGPTLLGWKRQPSEGLQSTQGCWRTLI